MRFKFTVAFLCGIISMLFAVICPPLLGSVLCNGVVGDDTGVVE